MIYGSYAQQESAKWLFDYSQYLKVYERPHARKLIGQCRRIGDIMVHTTAKRDYARRICELLDIQPIDLKSRKDCQRNTGKYRKTVADSYYKIYQTIIIIDDSPHVWDSKAHDHCIFLIPSEFRGDYDDYGLLKILKENVFKPILSSN